MIHKKNENPPKSLISVEMDRELPETSGGLLRDDLENDIVDEITENGLQVGEKDLLLSKNYCEDSYIDANERYEEKDAIDEIVGAENEKIDGNRKTPIESKAGD